MTRYRIQELFESLNDIISDNDLIFFPELKVALDKIKQTHRKNLKKYSQFLGRKYTVPYKDMVGKERKRKGTISEISNFYEAEVIVKLEFNPYQYEYYKLCDWEEKM